MTEDSYRPIVKNGGNKPKIIEAEAELLNKIRWIKEKQDYHFGNWITVISFPLVCSVFWLNEYVCEKYWVMSEGHILITNYKIILLSTRNKI